MNYCKIKNEDFKNFICLNGGWVFYEKCPVCSMRLNSDGNNHGEFWDNHIEDYDIEKDYYFDFDLERMQKAVESETVYLPKELKEKGEILDWLLNYDSDKIKSAINLSKSISGVEVLGDNKEERIKHMKQIFEDYEDK